MNPARRGASRSIKPTPLRPPPLAREICLELQDNSLTLQSAAKFFDIKGVQDPRPQAARLAEQFENQNRSLFSIMDVQLDRQFDGNDVFLCLRSGNVVGAIPLLSPTTAAPDYGLVVQPRFPWVGIGPMLAEMGWRVAPTPLKLPLLRRSERRVPPWVLSLMILARLRALLDSLERRFEISTEVKNAPRGSVLWSQYATRFFPRGDLLSIPCTFPDLRDDRQLKGAIRYTLERQLQSLQSQREHGSFVHRLVELCQQLLQRVSGVPVYRPSAMVLTAWLQRPLKAEHFVAGLEAIQWTIEDRGLAGLSDLEGIPWTMPMEQFFEAWVETVFQAIALKTGAVLKTGRKHETTRPINWYPGYIGAQQSLVPDIWLQWESTTLIVDAKYKRHWEEFQWHARSQDLQEELKQQHRNDLLQGLAYANLSSTQQTIACLAYPCSPEDWEQLRLNHRLIQRAEITVNSRSLHIWLTAIPMTAQVESIAAPLASNLRELIFSLANQNY